MPVSTDDLNPSWTADESKFDASLYSYDFDFNSTEIQDMFGDSHHQKRAEVLNVYLEAQSALQQSLLTAQATYASACVEANGAIEAARLDAVARAYEADKNVEGIELQCETDRYVVDQETSVELAKLEVEREKIELEYYRIQQVDSIRAQAMLTESQGEYYEGLGEYEYDSARAANQNTSSDSNSWDLVPEDY